MKRKVSRGRIFKQKPTSLRRALTRCQTTFLRLPNIEAILADSRGVAKALEESGLPMFVDDMVITRHMYRKSENQENQDSESHAGEVPQPYPSSDHSSQCNSIASVSSVADAVAGDSDERLTRDDSRDSYSFCDGNQYLTPEITSVQIEFLFRDQQQYRPPVTRSRYGQHRFRASDNQIMAHSSEYPLASFPESVEYRDAAQANELSAKARTWDEIQTAARGIQRGDVTDQYEYEYVDPKRHFMDSDPWRKGVNGDRDIQKMDVAHADNRFEETRKNEFKYHAQRHEHMEGTQRYECVDGTQKSECIDLDKIYERIDADRKEGLADSAQGGDAMRAAQGDDGMLAVQGNEHETLARVNEHPITSQADAFQNAFPVGGDAAVRRSNDHGPADEVTKRATEQTEQSCQHENEDMDTSDHGPSKRGINSMIDLRSIRDSTLRGFSKSMECFGVRPWTLKEFLLLR